MKLKKIASLALAGIMAVSMLAGCSTTSVEPTPTPDPDPEQPNVSGYSQMLYNHLSYTAKKKVEPQDSNDVNDALATAMEYAAGNTIAGSYDDYIDGDTHVVNPSWGGFFAWAAAPDSLKNGAKALIRELGAENRVELDQDLDATFNVLDPDGVNYNRDDMNISMLFVADGRKGKEAVMDEIADMIDDNVKLLEDDFDWDNGDTTDESMNTDYDYTMSVAADTITLDADHGKSMTFVAVNIARV